MLALVLALGVATATPTPTPSRTPTAQKLGEAAGGIRIKRTVSFDQRSVPKTNTFVGVTAKYAVPSAEPSVVVPTVDHEALWTGRSMAGFAAIRAAAATLAQAEARAPGCRTLSTRSGNNVDCTARDGALLPYRLAVSAAQAADDETREACRHDSWCLPGWVR